MSRSPLDLDRETMQRLGHQVTDLIADHLATMGDQPVITPIARRELNSSLMAPPPEQGRDFDGILNILKSDVLPYHAREPHPGFLAYVSSCPTFPALLGDWIATGFNFFAGVWPIAPGPNEIEMVVLDWIRRWMGMPASASGLLTSGGSAANMTAFVAARHAAVDRGADINKLIVYTSAHAHSSVVRAAWISGIPRSNVRLVETDELFRIVPSDLKRAVEEDRKEGLTPFVVAASAGTTNTGSVDPLNELADYCDGDRLWLHVDAAYAGFAVLTEEGRRMLDGIGRADSLTVDPHKWLFVPFECGCLMMKDPNILSDAFRIMPEYLKDVQPAEEEVNFADRGEQLTRYSRALKIWMSVNYFGTAAISHEIQRGMERARLLESLVASSSDFEILCPAQFGIFCFRATPASVQPAQLDALNERINARVVAGRRFLISPTRLRGNYSLRMCTLGYRTTDDDIRRLFSEIENAVKIERDLGNQR